MRWQQNLVMLVIAGVIVVATFDMAWSRFIVFKEVGRYADLAEAAIYITSGLVLALCLWVYGKKKGKK